jgi:hypothetical protein
MSGAMPLPLWVVALVLAAVAPAVAKTMANVFERRARERSRQILLTVTPSEPLPSTPVHEPTTFAE